MRDHLVVQQWSSSKAEERQISMANQRSRGIIDMLIQDYAHHLALQSFCFFAFMFLAKAFQTFQHQKIGTIL